MQAHYTLHKHALSIINILLSYYYIRSAGGYARYTMLDVSSWSESVTNRRPSTLKMGGGAGVELGPPILVNLIKS